MTDYQFQKKKFSVQREDPRGAHQLFFFKSVDYGNMWIIRLYCIMGWIMGGIIA